MAKDVKLNPDLDDIVFEIRNKDYGAYQLRKKYNRTVIVAIMVGIMVISMAVITPYLNAKALENRQKRAEREVEIKLENLDAPDETVAPPPPPPPPPADVVQQQKYVPPVVVDSVKPEEASRLMTADDAQNELKDNEVVEVTEVKAEVQESEPEELPFIVVEEMPEFPGGVLELQKYIAANTKYPEISKENNIQGRVIVRFCVTAKGGISQVSIIRGVDPELDAEAIRVVNSLPAFKPGKQGGKPVPVWYSVPFTFKLN
jgi:periplasmic protein TonB